MWTALTIGLNAEIKLRFQISSAQCERGPLCVQSSNVKTYKADPSLPSCKILHVLSPKLHQEVLP